MARADDHSCVLNCNSGLIRNLVGCYRTARSDPVFVSLSADRVRHIHALRICRNLDRRVVNTQIRIERICHRDRLPVVECRPLRIECNLIGRVVVLGGRLGHELFFQGVICIGELELRLMIAPFRCIDQFILSSVLSRKLFRIDTIF